MLSNKQIKTLAEDKRFDWTDRRCFTDNFQKHDKPGTQRLSVLELDEAYKNSQDVYDSELIPFLRSKGKNLSKEMRNFV